jgi:hypothetical protein
VVNMTNRPNVAMRLVPLKPRLTHRCGFLSKRGTSPSPETLERVMGIEPT